MNLFNKRFVVEFLKLLKFILVSLWCDKNRCDIRDTNNSCINYMNACSGNSYIKSNYNKSTNFILIEKIAAKVGVIVVVIMILK